MYTKDARQHQDQQMDQQDRSLSYEKPTIVCKPLGEIVRGGPLSGGTDFQSKRFS